MQLEFALDDAPPLHKPGAALRRILLPGGLIWYGFVRARRKTLTIVVERGMVEVRAPRWTPMGEIESFLREKERWIRRRIDEARRIPPPFVWREGERLPLLGEPVRLVLAEPGSGVALAGQDLRVGLRAAGPAALRASVLEWLMGHAQAVFHERIAVFAPRIGVREPQLRLSNARTQWGSCNAHGRVLLNWRLVHAPLRLVDYVVAHELAHMRELNHSRRFWAVVESAYPDYRVARRELNRLEKQLPVL
jgi:predicted metal-dependent hydrolase